MRFYGLDILRGIAAFFIVGCHLQLIDYTPCGYGLLRFCDMNVGLFAALAGYLMAGGFNEQVVFQDWCKWTVARAVRLLPSYIFWTFVYLITSALFQLVVTGTIKPKYGEVRFWWNVIWWGGSATHLWFISALLYTQVVYRAISGLMRFWMWLCLGVVVVFISQYWDSWYARYPLRVVSFVALGCSLRIILIHVTVKRVVWPVALIISGVLLHCLVGSFLPCFIKDFLSVTLILPGFALLPIKSASGWVKLPSDVSMGVYLIHPLFTVLFATVIKKMVLAPYGVAPTLSVWLLSYIFSSIVSVGMLRNRVLCRFVQ